MKLLLQDDKGNTLLEREIKEEEVTLRVQVKAGTRPTVHSEEMEEPTVAAYH